MQLANVIIPEASLNLPCLCACKGKNLLSTLPQQKELSEVTVSNRKLTDIFCSEHGYPLN